MSETPQDTHSPATTQDRRYSGTPSIRMGEDDRRKLLALIDAGIVPDLAAMVRTSIHEHYERMLAHTGGVWPEAVIPALLLAPAKNGMPYICPFTQESLIGRVGLSILPGPVIGPYVSARFLTDEIVSSPPSAPAAAPKPAQPVTDSVANSVAAPEHVSGDDAEA